VSVVGAVLRGFESKHTAETGFSNPCIGFSGQHQHTLSIGVLNATLSFSFCGWRQQPDIRFEFDWSRMVLGLGSYMRLLRDAESASLTSLHEDPSRHCAVRKFSVPPRDGQFGPNFKVKS
jgi:hypothetical protein